MKAKQIIGGLVLGALVLVLSLACSVVNPGHTRKTHLSLSSPSASRNLSQARSAPAGHAATAKNLQVKKAPMQRSLLIGGGTGSRDLSASAGDIASITFTLTNDSRSGSGEDFTDTVDADYPYVDLILTPGDTYTAKVVVKTTSTAPGHSVGITEYGDTKQFTLPSDADWTNPYYVDLFIKPSSAYVFLPGLTWNGTNTVVKYFDQADAGQTVKSVALFNGHVYGDISDKFFYDAAGTLYFWSGSYRALYLWQDMNTPMDPTEDPENNPDCYWADASYGYDIETGSVTPDPYYPGVLYAAIQDSTAVLFNYPGYYIGYLDFNSATFDGVADVTYGINPDYDTTPGSYFMTGIATYFDDYYNYNFAVSFYGASMTSGGTASSGVLKTDWGGYSFTTYPEQPMSAVASPVPASATLPRDIGYVNGRLYVICSPAYAYPSMSGIVDGTVVGGKSELWVLDTDLNPVSGISTAGLSTGYQTKVGATKNGKLVYPMRFIAPPKDGYLYVSQWPVDYNAYYSSYFSDYLSTTPWTSWFKIEGTGLIDGPTSASDPLPNT